MKRLDTWKHVDAPVAGGGRAGRRGRRLAAGLVALGAAWAALATAAAPAGACMVPVFRYALERWPAAPYKVYVFHRGPLSPGDEAALSRLRGSGRPDAPDAPVDVAVVDLDAKPAGEAAKVWERQSDVPLPWMVVRYPMMFGVAADAWAGPLAAEAADLLLDSPARRKVARRILEGDCAVFVLLESGRAEADDAAARLIETELKRLQEELELPQVPDGMWDDPRYDTEGPPALKVAFSLVRVSRADPAERLFVRLLVGIDPDLAGVAEPIAFPVMGRGRLLGALVGDQIQAAHVEDACVFFVSPCSCIVKEQNPGIDMLMTVDWDAALAGKASAIPEVVPPPLTGVADFLPVETGAAAPAPAGAGLARNLWLAAGGAAGLVLVALVAWRVLSPGRS